MADWINSFWVRVYRITVMPDYVMGRAAGSMPFMLEDAVPVRYTKAARGESNS